MCLKKHNCCRHATFLDYRKRERPSWVTQDRLVGLVTLLEASAFKISEAFA
jgi:hypothetical protein